MPSLALELVISCHILFDLHPVYVTLKLLFIFTFNYSQVIRDDVLIDCSFYFVFAVYITHIEK